MIPDGQLVETGIKFVVGSLGLGAATPAFRVLGGFFWEIVMDRARAKTYDYVKDKTGHLVKDKIGFAMENNVHHLSIKIRDHEFMIHHPNRDKTHERYTLLTHYMHPERFSPLVQQRVDAKILGVVAEKTASVVKLPGERTVMLRAGLSVYD